jgi:hypothetical protein
MAFIFISMNAGKGGSQPSAPLRGFLEKINVKKKEYSKYSYQE